MRVILYDNSDSKRPDARHRTLRVLDDTGLIVMQGMLCGGGDCRKYCELIADAYGVPLEFVGPVETPAETELAAVRNTVCQYCPDCDEVRLHVPLSDLVVECAVCGAKGAVTAACGPVERRDVAQQGLLF